MSAKKEVALPGRWRRAVVESDLLDSNAKHFCLTISAYLDNNAKASVSHERVASYMGKSIPRVKAGLTAAKKAGFLRVDRGGYVKEGLAYANRYEVMLPDGDTEQLTDEPFGMQNDTSEGLKTTERTAQNRVAKGSKPRANSSPAVPLKEATEGSDRKGATEGSTDSLRSSSLAGARSDGGRSPEETAVLTCEACGLEEELAAGKTFCIPCSDAIRDMVAWSGEDMWSIIRRVRDAKTRDDYLRMLKITPKNAVPEDHRQCESCGGFFPRSGYRIGGDGILRCDACDDAREPRKGMRECVFCDKATADHTAVSDDDVACEECGEHYSYLAGYGITEIDTLLKIMQQKDMTLADIVAELRPCARCGERLTRGGPGSICKPCDREVDKASGSASRMFG